MRLATLAAAAATLLASTSSFAASTYIHAGRVIAIPGQAPRGATTIVVTDGRIESLQDGYLAAPAGAKEIDLKDKTVLPGLIDSHTHLSSDRAGNEGIVAMVTEGMPMHALETYWNGMKTLRAGFTTVRNLGDEGGKTLALGAAMRNTGRLYAFDVSGHRLEALKPRLARSGLSNVHPAAIAHERDERIKRLAGKIDRVLVDAPCSGLGTLRRNPDLKWRQSEKAVAELVVKQTAILDSAARLVKSGGRLVYATCSVLPQENELIAQAFSQAHPDFVPLNAAQTLAQLKVEGAEGLCTEGGDFLRLWPHRHATDGFFAAVWVRK